MRWKARATVGSRINSRLRRGITADAHAGGSALPNRIAPRERFIGCSALVTGATHQQRKQQTCEKKILHKDLSVDPACLCRGGGQWAKHLSKALGTVPGTNPEQSGYAEPASPFFSPKPISSPPVVGPLRYESNVAILFRETMGT